MERILFEQPFKDCLTAEQGASCSDIHTRKQAKSYIRLFAYSLIRCALRNPTYSFDFSSIQRCARSESYLTKIDEVRIFCTIVQVMSNIYMHVNVKTPTDFLYLCSSACWKPGRKHKLCRAQTVPIFLTQFAVLERIAKKYFFSHISHYFIQDRAHISKRTDYATR